VAVLAILTSLALPSYRAILEKRRVTSGAEQAMAFLSSAQLESVKRNQFVAVDFATYTDTDGNPQWCLGFTAGDNPEGLSCDCQPDSDSCTVDGVLRTFHSTNLNYPDLQPSIDADVTVFGFDSTFLFDPVRGLVLRDTDSNEMPTIDLKLISPDQSSYAVNVGLSPTGRVKICSDALRGDKVVPGYEECPP